MNATGQVKKCTKARNITWNRYADSNLVKEYDLYTYKDRAGHEQITLKHYKIHKNVYSLKSLMTMYKYDNHITSAGFISVSGASSVIFIMCTSIEELMA